MLNLSEQRQIEANASNDDKVIVSIRLETFSQLLDIAEAAKAHSDSFNGAHGVLVVGPPEKQIEVNEAAKRLDKLLEDVEIGDE